MNQSPAKEELERLKGEAGAGEELLAWAKGQKEPYWEAIAHTRLPPTQERWTRICELLDSIEEKDWPALDAALSLWPPDLRLAPKEWLYPQPRAILRLARAI